MTETAEQVEPTGRRLTVDDGIRLLNELREGEGGGQWSATLLVDGEDRKLPLFMILVDTTPYDGKGYCWLPLDHIAPGTASVYPVKARTADGGPGQWRFGEIRAIVITDVGEEWLRRREMV